MDPKEILNFCFEKGILMDKDTFNMFKDTNDVNSVKFILEKVKEATHQKIITREVITGNRESLNKVLQSLPKEKQKRFEKLKISLGMSIEISKEDTDTRENGIDILPDSEKREFSITNAERNNFQVNNTEGNNPKVKILSRFPFSRKKLEMSDFNNFFRSRFSGLKMILENNPRLENLISIDKIFGINQKFSIIGMVYDKRTTKNKNIIFEVEDLTGKIKVVVTQKNKEQFKMAENVALDSVMGFSGSGNKEILFANEVVFPDAGLLEKKKAPVEESVVFISDIHVGSKNFKEENFLNFIDYLNGKIGDTDESEKIKYLFVVGDLVAGVGVYPNQEKELFIKDIEAQYTKFAEYISKIRNDITIVIIPGNHDCVRLMEPQPLLDEKYAWTLYNLKNVLFTSNPSIVNIGSTEKFPGFNILMYHGFSYPYYAHNIPSLIEEKAGQFPDKVMKYLLKNRHLAPTHTSVQHSPSEQDHLIINPIPDIFVSGHVHKNTASYHNNILVLSTSCWEDLMPYQEKMGFESDYCKVPLFNLKTGKLKILDFE